MKRIAVLALALTGCATVSSVAHGPNGRPLHHIEAMSATAAYNKASEKCADGYDIITTRQQGLFTVMDVECH